MASMLKMLCFSSLSEIGWIAKLSSPSEVQEIMHLINIWLKRSFTFVSVYHRRDSLLASSSYNGDIFIWSVDKEDVIVALNMYQSILPISLNARDTKGWI